MCGTAQTANFAQPIPVNCKGTVPDDSGNRESSLRALLLAHNLIPDTRRMALSPHYQRNPREPGYYEVPLARKENYHAANSGND
jgi:hypothetical protein